MLKLGRLLCDLYQNELCSEMHSIKCLSVYISITRCPLAFSQRLHHHFWQEIQAIKVIKLCPPNSFPAEDINSNPNPNLENYLNADANP